MTTMAKKKISPEVFAKLDEVQRELHQLIELMRARVEADERRAQH